MWVISLTFNGASLSMDNSYALDKRDKRMVSRSYFYMEYYLFIDFEADVKKNTIAALSKSYKINRLQHFLSSIASNKYITHHFCVLLYIFCVTS